MRKQEERIEEERKMNAIKNEEKKCVYVKVNPTLLLELMRRNLNTTNYD